MNSKFEEFLFIEYENIAKAHFEAQRQLALFFRYYTLFFSVPIVILSFLKEDGSLLMTVELFAYLLIALGAIGFSFYWVTINLKHEAVLYARTVNGIRYFFYHGLKKKLKTKIQTLPTITSKPKYFSPDNPILLIMMIVNSVYFMLGLYYLKLTAPLCYILTFIVSTLIHFTLNYFLSSQQEKRYTDTK